MKARFLLAALLILLPFNALQAQHLEAVGLSASFNISQTRSHESVIQIGNYTFLPSDDGSRTDDTGNRYSAFARLGFGAGRVFIQPEIAYT